MLGRHLQPTNHGAEGHASGMTGHPTLHTRWYPISLEVEAPLRGLSLCPLTLPYLRSRWCEEAPL